MARLRIIVLSNSAVCGARHTAEFERAIIVERVNADIARAKANGTKSGRPIGRPAMKRKQLDAA
jgi:DNA invertase Pin-like site-specific DNA recombinase